MYACKALGPSTIGNYEKNGAMLHYIKVLLRTPAECMQNGTCKMEKREDEEICVGQLFLSSAASQRCWRFGNSNFFVVEMILGFWCIQLVRLGVTYWVEYGGMWHFLFLHRKVEPLFIYFFDYFFYNLNYWNTHPARMYVWELPGLIWVRGCRLATGLNQGCHFLQNLSKLWSMYKFRN